MKFLFKRVTSPKLDAFVAAAAGIGCLAVGIAVGFQGRHWQLGGPFVLFGLFGLMNAWNLYKEKRAKPTAEYGYVETRPRQLGRFYVFGVLLSVFFCMVPALALNGFGFGIPLSLLEATAAATIGGAVSGLLICPRPILAGLMGGMVAGPMGMLAVYYYTQYREAVFNLEIATVQVIGSLPGVGLGMLIYYIYESTAPRKRN